MAAWTMGVEAGNHQEGQPSQITFSQPTKFLIRFTVSCDSSSDGITQPRANLWKTRAPACGQTCELFARVDLSDQSAAMAAIAMVFRTENRRPRDPRSKPTELRHLLFNLADHATATALPFYNLGPSEVGRSKPSVEPMLWIVPLLRAFLNFGKGSTFHS